MPTLTIEGRRVTVGDEFLSMSPEQQGAAVEEIAGSLGISAPAAGDTAHDVSPAMSDALASASRKSREFFGENSGPPGDTYGGVGMNATAGVNEGIYGWPGYFVDGMAGVMNAGIRGANAMTGAEIPTIDDPMFGSRHLQRLAGGALGEIHPALDPANTKARTAGERSARAVGEGVGSSVAGAGVVGALARTGALSAPAAQTAANLFGRSGSAGVVAGEATISGAATAGANAAAESAPDQWKPLAALAGGLVTGGTAATAAGIPGAVRGTARLAGDAVAPFTAGGQERLAAQRFQAGTSNPAAALRTLDAGGGEIVPGSMPTTGQLTGDLGILAQERGAQTRSPAAFAQRRADQNAARLDAMETIQPAGAPEMVTSTLRQRLADIDRRTEDAVVSAQGSARTSAEALGRGMRPEEAGDAVRAAIESSRAPIRAEERRLWFAVDPDGTLIAPATGIRAEAQRIAAELPASARRPEGEEAAILDVVSGYSDAMPFREVSALRSRLGDAMREERRLNGETPAYRRLTMMRGALERDLEGAISSKVAQEAEAVAAGTMRMEDTLEARWIAKAEEQLAGREQQAATGFAGGAGAGYASRGRSTAFPGSAGAGRQAGGRSGSPAGDTRLPPEVRGTDFDGAARERLTAASTATRDRVATFDNPMLGPIRRQPMPSAAIPARLFFPGAKSAEAVGTYRRAVGDGEAMRVLEDYATDRLLKSAMRDDGTLDPTRVTAWRRSHSDALRAFPELDARFADAARASETVAEVARVRKVALDEAQADELGALMGVSTPAEVSNIIGGLLSRQDAASRMAALRRTLSDNPGAQAGLRKAVADYMTARLVGNAEVGSSGREGIKSDAFQTFVARNGGALRAAGFSDDQIKVMRDIADDLQRTNRSVVAVKNPGTPGTAQDALAAGGEAGGTILRRLVYSLAASGGGAVYTGSWSGLAAGILPEVVGGFRRAGLRSVEDIVTDAILNPSRARALLMRPGRKTEAATVKMMAQLYRRAAASSAIAATKEAAR